ncbi:MAG: hypothetical protein ABR600_04165 [Actinomycetota bacterium]
MALVRNRTGRLVTALSLTAATALVATMLSFSASPAGAEDVVHPLSFGATVVLPQSGSTGSASSTCYNPCGEPSMIVGPDNTVYVSTPRTLLVCCNSKSSPVWKSTDGGTTWSNPIFPSAPAAQANAFTGGDTQLAVDKRGVVYEGELWLGSDSMYISGDKGATWSWSPVSHDVLDDREWLVYAEKEDAIYGIYDAIKGLEVIKIPLTTPLGSDAARVAPIERLAVPEWNDCPGILAGPCVGKPSQIPDEVNGVPVLAGLTSPGRPAVDQRDGTVYFPFPYQVAGKGIGIAVTTDGINFQYRYVTGAGRGSFGDTGNDFPVAAVDAAGNLYIAWSEKKGSDSTIYLSTSKDKGVTWSGPFAVSDGVSGTAIFPNIVAGAPGRVAVSWFGSPDVGDPNAMPNAVWDVDAAVTLDALDAQPTFDVAAVKTQFHKGNICTHGSGCTSDDRKLLDFFDMQLDRTNGALLVVYARDKAGHPGATGTDIAFNRQTDGCSLTQPGVYLGPGTPASPGTPPTSC